MGKSHSSPKNIVHRLWLPLLTMVALTQLSGLLHAQVLGSIRGLVSDATGAVIPEASVTLTDIGTGQVRTGSSSGEGYFVFPDLPPREYSLTISAKGFQQFVYKSLVLEVGQHLSVKPTLGVGSVTTTIEVVGTPPPVATESASISQVVDRDRIEALPLNGRNALQLIGLAASAVYAGKYGQFGAMQISMKVAGGRSVDVNYSLDGGFHMNDHYNIAVDYPNPDALQEFRVTSNSYDAEFGRGSNDVTAVSRSGTNEFHGSVFEFLRNTNLDARPFFAANRSVYKRNQYGASLGGPLAKNKAFFFGSYQGTKSRGTPGESRYRTLTAAERTGDFSGLTTPLKDPDNPGTTFAGNIIPPDRIRPFATQFIDEFLSPANSGPDFFAYTPNYTTDQTQVLAKIDFVPRDDDRISFRYFLNDTPQRGNGFGALLDSSWLAELPTRNQSWTLREDHIFSPTLINDLVFTYVRNAFGVRATKEFNLADLGLPVNLANSISNFGLTPHTEMLVSGYFGAGPGVPTRDIYATWQIKDDITWTKGKHTVKVGATLYHNRVNQLQNFLDGGATSFSGWATGNGAADFLLGKFSYYTQAPPLITRLRQKLPAVYAQDQYRVTKSVTLNLGLRWEPYMGWVSENDVLALWRPPVQSTKFPNMAPGMLYPGDDGLPRSIVGNRMNNFAPRIGIAWDVRGNGRTSVRVGAGTFYMPQTRGLTFNRFPGILPYSLTALLLGADIENIWAPSPFNGVNPFPRPEASNLEGLKQVEFIEHSGFTTFVLPFKTQCTNQWSLSIQHAIGSSSVIEANYVGSSSQHLLTSSEVNPAVYIPGESTVANTQDRRLHHYMGAINAMHGALNANYNSFQLDFRRRYHKGLTVVASYAWSKTLGINGSFAEGSSGQRDPFNRRLDYGRLAYDVRHNFVTSFVWELPWAKAAQSAFVRNVIGGWEVNGINMIRSGFPFTARSGMNRSLTGISADTADLVGDPKLPGGRSRAEQIAKWFNTDAFAPNPIGTVGTAGINILGGPAFWNLDLGVVKNFKLSESKRLEFRSLFYNIFNHPSLDSPGGCSSATATNYCSQSRTSPTFGRITSTASDPRVIEFALKFSF